MKIKHSYKVSEND